MPELYGVLYIKTMDVDSQVTVMRSLILLLIICIRPILNLFERVVAEMGPGGF